MLRCNKNTLRRAIRADTDKARNHVPCVVDHQTKRHIFGKHWRQRLTIECHEILFTPELLAEVYRLHHVDQRTGRRRGRDRGRCRRLACRTRFDALTTPSLRRHARRDNRQTKATQEQLPQTFWNRSVTHY